MICDVDEPVILKGVFTDPETEEPIDPEKIDSVVCTVLEPTGETSTPEVDRSEDEKGIYTARFIPSTHKKHHYAFDGFDADEKPIARAEREFEVRKPKVPRGE